LSLRRNPITRANKIRCYKEREKDGILKKVIHISRVWIELMNLDAKYGERQKVDNE